MGLINSHAECRTYRFTKPRKSRRLFDWLTKRILSGSFTTTLSSRKHSGALAGSEGHLGLGLGAVEYSGSLSRSLLHPSVRVIVLDVIVTGRLDPYRKGLRLVHSRIYCWVLDRHLNSYKQEAPAEDLVAVD